MNETLQKTKEDLELDDTLRGMLQSYKENTGNADGMDRITILKYVARAVRDAKNK